MTNYELARRWMANSIPDYYDGIEINCTRMTENCADELDIYEDEDYTIPDWLRELACLLDPSLEERLLYWEYGDGWTRLVNQAYKAVATGNPGPLPHVLSENKVRDLVMAVIDKRVVMLPLYLYDHSGLTMNTSGYSCPWDSGQVGYIYATRDTILKEFSAKKLTARLRKKAEDILRSEVKTYAQYLEGDVYGYVIYKIDEDDIDPEDGVCNCDPEPWNDYPPCKCTKGAEVVDSCCGFYGSDEALKEGESMVRFFEEHEPKEQQELLAGQVGPKE